MARKLLSPGLGTTSGLTFLELLVALCVLGVTLALGLPAFADFAGNSRLTSERNRLAADLRYARNEAIYRNAQVVACPSANRLECLPAPNWHEGWLVFVDQDLDREHDPGETVLRAAEPMQQVKVLAPRSRRRIKFISTGRTPGSNVTFTLCDRRGSEHAVALIISNSGHIRQAEKGPAARRLRCPDG